MKRFSTQTRRLSVVGLAFVLLAFVGLGGCKTERKSQGQRPNSQAVEDAQKNVAAEPGADQHVRPQKPPLGGRIEPNVVKAQKVVNQLTNYSMSIAAKKGESPADLEALKGELRSQFGLNWPNDPWGNSYIYEKGEGLKFVIFSAGKDKKAGTEDDIRTTN